MSIASIDGRILFLASVKKPSASDTAATATLLSFESVPFEPETFNQYNLRSYCLKIFSHARAILFKMTAPRDTVEQGRLSRCSYTRRIIQA